MATEISTPAGSEEGNISVIISSIGNYWAGINLFSNDKIYSLWFVSVFVRLSHSCPEATVNIAQGYNYFTQKSQYFTIYILLQYSLNKYFAYLYKLLGIAAVYKNLLQKYRLRFNQ